MEDLGLLINTQLSLYEGSYVDAHLKTNFE